RYSESRRAQSKNRDPKRVLVQRVEKLTTKLQLRTFRDVRVLDDREIQVAEACRPVRISPQVARRRLNRRAVRELVQRNTEESLAESSGVRDDFSGEELLIRPLALRLQRGVLDQVRPRNLDSAILIETEPLGPIGRCDCEWETRLIRDDPQKHPSLREPLRQ